MTETLEIAPGYEPLLAAHGLCTLAGAFTCDRGRRLDKSGLETWRQRWRITLADDRATEWTFYLKRFDHPPLRRQLERWRRGRRLTSTAGVEWGNARQLAAAGIPAAEAIAFGEQMAGAWERRSFILLREVRGESLERWLPAHVPPADQETDWRRRRARLDRFARWVAGFHAAGFVHRDLYLSHIFVGPVGDDDWTEAGGQAEALTLIDLQRVFRPRWRHRRWVVKDLAALNFSAPARRVGRWERLRFLCRYVRHCDRFGSARELARRVEAKTARIARRAPRPAG